MRKLFLDIETSPHVAYVWRLYDENVGLSQLIASSRVICVAWKFDDEPVEFAAEWAGGHKRMLKRVHAAMNEADALVHYNGTSFDEKHLNREFLEAKMDPPARSMTVDLFKTIKGRFRFASGKLEHVASTLELREGKLKTDFTLWRDVLAGDPAARLEMETYNREDVELTESLYYELLPWIDKHPNVALYEGGDDLRCTRCGAADLVRDGYARTTAGTFQRYRCRQCGGQSRGMKRDSTTPLREA
jgi:predicted RNA-binding Zn-ribbon protein involved in translation (DUF1610 family)